MTRCESTYTVGIGGPRLRCGKSDGHEGRHGGDSVRNRFFRTQHWAYQWTDAMSAISP